jgi:small-conductance mechanosensitive channel
MQDYIDHIPFSLFLTFILVGLALYLVLYILDSYVIPTLKEKRSSIDPLWQKIKIISWLLLFGVFYSTLFRKNMAITLVFTVVILGLGWNYWRNVFSGILIKFKNQLKVGDYISTDFTKGIIRSVSLAQSELVNEKGELVIIPNYKLRSSVLKHLQETNNVKVYTFLVKSSNKESVEDIHKLALNCPYISVNQDIVVKREQSNKFQIKASIIDNSFVEMINKYFDEAIKT